MTNLCKKSIEFTVEERTRLLEQHRASGLSYLEFANEHNISPQTMKNWIWYSKHPNVSKKTYSPTEKKKIIESYLASGLSKKEFSKAWGVSSCTLSSWVSLYQELGSDGLMPKARRVNDGRLGPKIPLAVQEEILKIKRDKPERGIKNIRNWLYRFRGMKVSTGSVRKTVVTAGLPLAKKPKKKKRSSDRIRRFERAKPMQLWQSDITQFTLGQYWSRVYLTVFMDDHSRYIVGWRLQSRQTAELVMDAFRDAVARFGKPEEALTDQGRQYFAWRGKSEFEKMLEREGIKHVVSRAHHPQTLGKCERFWETVANEFWTRAKPQDLEEARVRLKHFIDHYNHQRPHQGLDGHVPADRFFGIAQDVREAIEKTVEQNALKMSIGEIPKPPAFLIGQVGDQRIAFHGAMGKFYLTNEKTGEISGEQDREQSRSSGSTSGSGSNKEAATNEIAGEHNGIPSDPDKGIVGEGVCRGESKGPGDNSNDNGILDGSFDEAGGFEQVGFETDSILAVNDPSSSRDNGRRTHTTPLQEGGIYG